MTFPPDVTDEPERLELSAVKPLPPADGKQWGRLPDGRLLRLNRVRLPFELANRWPRDSVALVDRKRIEDRTYGMAGGGHPNRIVETVTEAQIVGEDVYLRAQVNEEVRAAREARRRHPKPKVLDALARNPRLAARPPELVPAGPKPGDVVFEAMSRAARAVVLPGQQSRRGPESIVALLSKRGVALKLDAAGGLYAISSHGISADLQQLIDAARPLLSAHLGGRALRCTLPGHAASEDRPLAVSLAVGGAPICAGHADGRLEY